MAMPQPANGIQGQAVSTDPVAKQWPSSAGVHVAAPSNLYTSPPTQARSEDSGTAFCASLDGVGIEPWKLEDCFLL
jgi:hypothetical protein